MTGPNWPPETDPPPPRKKGDGPRDLWGLDPKDTQRIIEMSPEEIAALSELKTYQSAVARELMRLHARADATLIMKIEGQDTEDDGWAPIDLDPYLVGQVGTLEPDVGLCRADGLCLLYPGREHARVRRDGVG